MSTHSNISHLLLLFGDILLLYVSLFLTLVIRYGGLPSASLLGVHFAAFSVLFIAWLFIFFVAGLYDRQILLFPESLWQRILKTQAVNSLIAVIFFYSIPFFAIAPKTNLFIYLLVSFGLITLWRRWAGTLFAMRDSVQAVLVASGSTAEQVRERINNREHGLQISTHIYPDDYDVDDLYQATHEVIEEDEASLVILDTQNQVVQRGLSKLYNFLYADVYFVTLDALYETIFERIPLHRLEHEWFIEHIRRTPHIAYDTLKRSMDITVGGLLFLLTLPLYPFIALAIWLEDQGPIFYHQKRVGRFGEVIRIVKFRSMSTDMISKHVTRVGRFLRKTRIDELPQLWNVLEGKLSLIGPRPELPSLVGSYQESIPYYHARHLIKPGLSGWAQLRHDNPPKFAVHINETKEKLSYDLYYIKNRSLLLDIKIGLWTLRVLASRSGT
ncbi:MAG: sugar transferase [Candidatus Paceibacterota bacterium]